MLSQLTGTVLEIAPDHAVIDCHGVGYQVFCPGRALGMLEMGKQARVYTYLAVREDALTLYGFVDRSERQFFQMLTGMVSGVGPRIGLALLSSFSVAEMVAAISANQPSQLARASGVGKKLAEKIIVELKDKLGGFASAAEGVVLGKANGAATDLASALVNLGYQPKVAEAAAASAIKEMPEGGFDALFKLALRKAA
jgi:Holliday junction DNA helicase RuvA